MKPLEIPAVQRLKKYNKKEIIDESEQKAYCRIIAKEERLKQSPLFMDFERKIASLLLAMTGRTRLFAQILMQSAKSRIKVLMK